MPVKRILIFDLDGTLVDSMGPASALFCEMLSLQCGIQESLSRPVFEALMGKGPRAQFAEVLRITEALDESLLERLTAEYWATFEGYEAGLFPEVRDVLAGLPGVIRCSSAAATSPTSSCGPRVRPVLPHFSI